MNLILPRLNIKNLLRFLLFSFLVLGLFSVPSPSANAACGDYFSCNREIERVKKEITRLQGESNSLKNQIAYLDNQIYLSQLEIEAKEQQIKLLSGDIGELSQRLKRISDFLKYQEEIFKGRARSAYTSEQLSSFDIVLGGDNLDAIFRKIKYLKVLEQQDQETLLALEETRATFKSQKKTLETKKADVEKLKAEVEDHKVGLISQQNARRSLLAETQSSESRYQDLLKVLEAERAAILAALRSGGTRLGTVARGVRIGNQGSTGCSTGPHIHYEVRRASDNAYYNPCSYVGVSGGTCYSGEYAVYGGTVASKNKPGYFRPASPRPSSYNVTQSAWNNHMALDVVSGDGGVYASEKGTAYLVKDTSWRSWCPSWIKGGKYDGPAYGLYVVHPDGRKSVYWHIRP